MSDQRPGDNRGASRASVLVAVFFFSVLGVLAAGALYLSLGANPRAAELRFWHIQHTSPTKDVVEAAAKRFVNAQQGPAVPLKPEAIENDQFKTNFAISLGAGDPPDIFHTWGGGGLADLVREGHVLNIEAPADGIYPAAMDFCRVDGELYALPADVGVVVFWYNKDLFKTHGLTPPATWEELLGAVKTLRGKGVTPIALGKRQPWTAAFYFAYLVTRMAGSAHFDSARDAADGKSFSDAPFVDAGAKIRALIDAKAFSTGFEAASYEDSRREFFSGKAAMMLMGTWLVANAKKEAPEFLDKMAAFPFPSVGKAGDAKTVVGGVNAAYAVWSKTAHPKRAERLVRELAGKTAADEWVKTGRIPARSDVDLAALPKPTQAVIPILKASKRIQLYYDQALPKRVKEEHLRTTAAIFDGTLTPKQAADQMAKAVKDWQESVAGRQ